MQIQKITPRAERPNLERHPGLIDAYENPHPSFRASSGRRPAGAARPHAAMRRTRASEAPR